MKVCDVTFMCKACGRVWKETFEADTKINRRGETEFEYTYMNYSMITCKCNSSAVIFVKEEGAREI